MSLNTPVHTKWAVIYAVLEAREQLWMRYVRGKHQELTSNSEVNCAASPSGGLGYSLKPVSVCNYLTILRGCKKLWCPFEGVIKL